jgi:hypothetical protein
MKKYKLIKEYPGSPELGTIVDYALIDPATNYANYWGKGCKQALPIDLVENQSEFWEEIIEKDYEILSFVATKKHSLESRILTVEEIKKISKNSYNNSKLFNLDSYIKNNDGYWNIHSVKRLSDAEVFTIGDRVETEIVNQNACVIYGFEIVDNQLRVNHTLSYLLNQKYPETYYNKHLHLLNKRKPLFTTEDSVDIYEGNIYYALNANYPLSTNIIETFTARKNTPTGKRMLGILDFSTKEAAEEYILINKPCLSIKEILELNMDIKKIFANSLKRLVKSKLC